MMDFGWFMQKWLTQISSRWQQNQRVSLVHWTRMTVLPIRKHKRGVLLSKLTKLASSTSRRGTQITPASLVRNLAVGSSGRSFVALHFKYACHEPLLYIKILRVWANRNGGIQPPLTQVQRQQQVLEKRGPRQLLRWWVVSLSLSL